jgi:Domain of unknown function (DUF5666)
MNQFALKSWIARVGTGLAVLLTVTLASAAVAGVSLDSTPLAPKVKATVIVEGTVSSLTSPVSSGVGPVFTILDGAVSIDASGADITSGDPSGGPAVVQVGSRIAALLVPVVGGGPDRVATTVYVLPTTNTATLHGKVDAVDVAATTFQVAGVTVHVTAATIFGGNGLASLGDLHVGDIVLAVISLSGSSTTAERVMRLGTTPTPLERIEGTVVSIGTTSWVLSAGAKDMTIGVDAQTKIVGAPKAGDTVEVLGRTDSSGVFRASLIVPMRTPVVRLRGTVVSESSTSWVIAVGGSAMGGAAATTNTTVKVDSNTKIVGSPAVRDTVEALADKQSDGSLLATLITKVASPMTVTFEGVVNAIRGMEWTVGTTKVMVSRLTILVGSPKLRDNVKVEGIQPGGAPVIIATKITKL